MTDSPNRWEQSQHRASGEEYAKRFQKLADSGMDMHGEATLCDGLAGGPSRILDAGCGTGRVAVRLAELGHTCVGIDANESMLDQARLVAPELEWLHADLADVTLSTARDGRPFDLVVAAGNVIPLLAEGSEPRVISAIAGVLKPDGLLVAGFGLDAAHLPIEDAPVDLASYDVWCADVGLVLEERWATWNREPYDGGGYAVSIHRLKSR